jgi:hypothetical protein
MGIKTTISLSKGAVPREDKKEQADLVNDAVAACIPVVSQHSMDRSLDNNSRKIVTLLVRRDGVDLPGGHAAMERPDGSLMDPLDGSNHQSLADLNRALAPFGIEYRLNGIAIKLSAPSNPDHAAPRRAASSTGGKARPMA